MLEPLLIYLGSLISHGPDDVHDEALFRAAIDPMPIVSPLRIIVFEPGLRERFYRFVAVARMNVQVNVFGISPAPREHREREATAEHYGYAGIPDRVECLRVDLPLVRGDRFRPFKLKGRLTSVGCTRLFRTSRGTAGGW